MILRALFTSLLAIALLLVLAACSPLPLLNAVIPSGAYTRTGDLAYGDLARQKLDVYVPVNGSSGAKPVVVFFYGGSWESGDKADYRFAAEALTARGFVAVVPDYRLYPEVLFPDFLDDAAKAARWVKENIARYGGDPRRVFLMGHSAGAHIAAMLTLDGQYLAKVNLSPKDFRGMIGLAGPYDFLPLKKQTLKTIFGPEEGRWRSQPINYVSGNNPPLLLLVGKKDTLVSPGNTERLAAKVESKGGPVKMVEYADYGHTEMVLKLAAPLRGDGVVLDTVAEFIRSR